MHTYIASMNSQMKFYHAFRNYLFSKNKIGFFLYTSNAMSWWVYATYVMFADSFCTTYLTGGLRHPPPLKIYEVMLVKFKFWYLKMDTIFLAFSETFPPFWRTSPFKIYVSTTVSGRLTPWVQKFPRGTLNSRTNCSKISITAFGSTW
jgi:hypothetical protein